MTRFQALSEMIYSITRIAIGFLFSLHGIEKIFGVMSRDEPAELFSLIGVAGVIELVAGGLVFVGLYTPWAAFIASGLNEKKSIIFNQSSVPAHSEGAWILSCVARMGWLNRMTQFKEKAGKDKEKASVGLYAYPVLMAADILLYDTTHVPVGDDQKQHLELCRDIAQRFNNEFEAPDFLKIPEPLIQKNFSRIMSLKDGTKKMSKSDPSDLSRINLTDDKDKIINKIKKAKTDTMPMPNEEENLKNRPEALNLLEIYSSLSNQSVEKSKNEFNGKNFSDFKEKLSNLLVEKIEPILSNCKGCNSGNLAFFGSGTQHVEDVLQQKFKNSVILRMDIDVVESI